MTELDYMRQWKHEEALQQKCERDNAEHALRKRIAKLKEDAAARGISKSWCDPLVYDEIVGVDFGAGTFCWHKLHAGVSVSKLPLAKAHEVLTSFDPMTLVVVERAHLATPQTNQSLAQPFTAEELQRIYRDCEAKKITLLLFPHHHTRKCRDWAASMAPDLIDPTKSTDINDAKGLAYYVFHNNGIALGKPPSDFARCQVRSYTRSVRSISNIVLNAAAARGYDGQVFPCISKLSRMIPVKMKTECEFVSKNIPFSVMSLVMTEHQGKAVRFVHNGQALGACSWLRSVVGSSSVHHRGGRARSNMFWHRFRPFLKDYAFREFGLVTKCGASYTKFSQYTPELDEARRAAWRKVRHELKLAYRIAVELTAGLDPFDPLQQEWEA